MLASYHDADAARVACVFQECAGSGASAEAMLERWRAFASRPAVAGNVLLAREDGEVRGVAWSVAERSHERPSRQFRIVVRPDARRRGFGSALLAAIDAHAMPRALLQCEAHPRWRAGRKFLARHGFHARASLDRMERAIDGRERAGCPAGYRVREGDVARDGAAWCALHARCFAGALHYQTQEDADARALASEPGFLLLVGETERGEIAGYAHATADGASGSGALVELAVDPAHRGRGVGRALVAAVLHACARRGLARCELFVERAASAPKRLYANLGFDVRAGWTCWSRESAGTPNERGRFAAV